MDSLTLFNNCTSNDSEIQTAAYSALFDYLYRISYGIVYRQADGDALAQDCAQDALVKIHQELHGLLEPKAFLSWSRRIVHNRTIDELRKRKRLQPLFADEESETPNLPAKFLSQVKNAPSLNDLTVEALRLLLETAPISDRSRRVVNGRYLDNVKDEFLAEKESELAEKEVLPSHIQVTRSKNINKLKKWPQLKQFLEEAVEK